MNINNRTVLVIFVLAVALILPACSGNKSATGANSNARAGTPTPSKADEEKKQKEDEDKVRLDQKNALSEFIAKNYRGWKIAGTQSGFDGCGGTDSPCDVHISNGESFKVISLMIRQFERTDGTVYWLVFETRPIDRLTSKINAIRDSEKETVLASLSVSDCQQVIDELGSISRDDLEEQEYRAFDPRN